jgi:hypothetical protein
LKELENVNTLKAREAECFKKLLNCSNIFEHTKKKKSEDDEGKKYRIFPLVDCLEK